MAQIVFSSWGHHISFLKISQWVFRVRDMVAGMILFSMSFFLFLTRRSVKPGSLFFFCTEIESYEFDLLVLVVADS